ncbi:MAG: hypothetical protein PF568_04485 [Deltaproteobacteria bacterium]|jgi:hypothetical protein|nr:hypothetical protein [Deltaproteobacteria bacterium]
MITLHRAPWVLPISSPALADGAVIVDEERILAVGPYADLRLEGHDLALDHEARILMPGLINGHCHLELSPFADLGRQPVAPAAMAAWIADLLALRAGKDQGHGPSPGAALAALQADGVGLVLDIGNGLLPPTEPVEGIALHYVTELLGLSAHGTKEGLQTLAAHAASHHFTCHAPYSTSRVLLQAVK